MSKQVFEHGKYWLNCEPLCMPDGRFCAMVVVTSRANGSFVTSRRFPDPERFDGPDAAVAHARRWAGDWINRFG